MIRFLTSWAVGSISTRSLYAVWVRVSGVALVLWAAMVSADSWIAQAFLTVLLFILLAGGVALLALGIWGLMRDFHRFLRLRSDLHKRSA